MATSFKGEKLVLQGVLLFYNKTLLSYLIKINKSALCVLNCCSSQISLCLTIALLAKCIRRVAGIALIRGEPKQGGEYMRELRQ